MGINKNLLRVAVIIFVFIVIVLLVVSSISIVNNSFSTEEVLNNSSSKESKSIDIVDSSEELSQIIGGISNSLIPEDDSGDGTINGISEEEWNTYDEVTKVNIRMSYIFNKYLEENKEGYLDASIQSMIAFLSCDFSPYKDKIGKASYKANIEYSEYGSKLSMIEFIFENEDKLYIISETAGVNAVLKDKEFSDGELSFFKKFRLYLSDNKDNGKYRLNYM